MNPRTLLNIARDAIKDELFSKESIDVISLQRENTFLSDERATFVTLNIDGYLRGCMGSLKPHRKLIDDIIHNAKEAAFRDFRFQPLKVDEIEELNIEISLLTIPKLIVYESLEELKDKIKVGTHGVILEKYNDRATFLPQVWEQLPTFELFFESLCLKAGLNKDCLSSFPTIHTYEVEKYKE